VGDCPIAGPAADGEDLSTRCGLYVTGTAFCRISDEQFVFRPIFELDGDRRQGRVEPDGVRLFVVTEVRSVERLVRAEQVVDLGVLETSDGSSRLVRRSAERGLPLVVLLGERERAVFVLD